MSLFQIMLLSMPFAFGLFLFLLKRLVDRLLPVEEHDD